MYNYQNESPESNDNKKEYYKRNSKGFRIVHDVLLYNDQHHQNNPNHTCVKIYLLYERK